MIPRLVGLVADDLTGATDSAVQFAEAGWAAHLLRGRGAAPELGPDPVGVGSCLLAAVTGVRPATDDVAAERTAAAVRELAARGCERLYVKIDSTVRGSVAGQVRGALAGWADTHPGAAAVLCPAFPDQARTVVGGEVLVGGVPVARTAAGADPVTPVVDSHLERLVPGAVAATPAGLGRGEGGRVAIVDAATDAELDAIAACVDRLGPAWVAAGSAGLAAALARRWSRGRRPVGGAAAPRRAVTDPGTTRPPRTPCGAAAPRRAVTDPGTTRPPRTPCGAAAPRRILVGVSSRRPIALSAVRGLRDALGAPVGVTAPVHVVTTPAARADPTEVAADFGDRVAAQLARSSYDVLVLVGGDGAAVALDRIGATAVTVHSALAPGVPIGAIVGGAAHGVRVVTTSGGFGDAESLLRIVDRLRSGAHHRKEPA